MDQKENGVEERNNQETNDKELARRERLERLRKKRKQTLEKAEQAQKQKEDLVSDEKLHEESVVGKEEQSNKNEEVSSASAIEVSGKSEESVPSVEKQPLEVAPKGLLIDANESQLKKARKKMTKKAKIIIGIAIVILLVLIFIVMNWKKASEAQEKVDYHVYQVTEVDPLIFKGTVNAEKTSDFYLDQTLGKIEKIHVADGQAVKSTDVILTYKNEATEEQLNQLQRAQNKANLAVNNAQETLNAARNKKTTLETKLNQSKSKYNAVDSRRPDAEMQRQEYLAEVKQYEQSIDAQNDIILQAQQGLEAAQAELNDANASVDEMNQKVSTEIRAGMDGTVYVNEKGKTDLSVPVIQIVSPQTIVEASVSEYDYSRLKKDQEVTVKPVSTQEEIKGKITEIDKLPAQSTPSLAAGKDQGGSSVNYSFQVKVDKPLQYGYNVQVVLPIHEIRIPKKAIIEDNGEKFVYVYKDGKVVKTVVKIDDSEGIPVVTEGLKVNEKIIRDPDGDLTNGAEVVVGE